MKLNFEIEYRTNWGECVGVNLGDNDSAPILLTTEDGIIWRGSADVKLPTGGISLLYRYSIWRDGQCIRREQASMPHVLTPREKARSYQLKDFWLDPKRIAGVAIPIFSLRSEGSFGVGDFGDLKEMVDWAHATHMQALQILPINDTTITNTWTDSYPYNSISIYAYHPQYVDLRQLPALKDKKKAAAYEKQRKALNKLVQIDYEAVNKAKRAYLHDIFEQEGEATMASADYQTFAANNEEWLIPYAAFSVLRDKYGTPDFNLWPEHKRYDRLTIASFASQKEVNPQIRFYCYVQYILHIQLLAASRYARQKNVILKGDIPIGISRASVEAWVEPFYFNMNGQAGAPPDPFSDKGQNWGFPTYDWDYMLKDNLQWWLKRFRKMSEYFSAYRIDHILGFFRIWEIPTHSVHGLLGQFSPALPMSAQEIESFGLPFQKEFMTKPFINDEWLETSFGPLRQYMKTADGKQTPYDGKDPVQYVKETFLQHTHDDIWAMKEEFDTQRKVEAFYSGKKNQCDLEMKEAVYALISDVLFVPDHKDPEMYHPRISVQNDYIYTRLQEWEQAAFNRLYNHYFYQRHNQFWYDKAMQKLPRLINATQMIVCGEDLGMVPDCVPWVMNQLQIISLEIQRMPKSPQDEFGHVYRYPVRSVCTTGTHDTETLRQWWELDRTLTQRFWNNELGMAGDAPMTADTDVCRRIVNDHLACPSLFCILPLQDWLAIDETLRLKDVNAERINIPANPRHYWRYRMHLTIDQLMKAKDFNQQIRDMIQASGR